MEMSMFETPQNFRRNGWISSASVVNKWRERRTSAPARRQSVVLSASATAIHARGNSLVIHKHNKLDSDDDTNYSASTNNTPASLISRRGARRSSYGSDISDLSPPLISPPSQIHITDSSTGSMSTLLMRLIII